MGKPVGFAIDSAEIVRQAVELLGDWAKAHKDDAKFQAAIAGAQLKGMH